MSKDVNMNYYVENNLKNSLPKIFGSSSAMSLEAYYCENVWEVVMQDGCGNEIMNVNNCDPNHPKLDCSKIIPSIPSTTTAGPTVGPTTGPTVGPPVDRPTAYFLDYLHWVGDVNYQYWYYINSQRYSHRMSIQGNGRDYTKLYLDTNNNPMSGSGNGLFWWNTPDSGATGIIYRPVINVAVAHPGLRYDPDFTSPIEDLLVGYRGFYLDPDVPSPSNNQVTIKVYAELEDGSQRLVADELSSFCSTFADSSSQPICVPFLTKYVYLERLNYPSMSTRFFRMELSCDLGTDIIYVPLVDHPRTECALLPVGGPYPDQNCDYEILFQ